MSTTHVLKKGDFIRDGRGHTLVTTCTTGSESSNSSLGGTALGADDGLTIPNYGMSLGGVAALDLLIEATTEGQTFGEGGVLEAWVFSPYQRLWARCPDLDRNIQAGLALQTFLPLKVDSRLGYICFLPADVGVACRITLTACPPRI